MKIYSTKQAAEYIGITVQGMWYHIQAGHIVPQKAGKTLVFTQDQLDELQASRTPKES